MDLEKTIETINSQIEAKNQEISSAIESKATTESVKNLTDELQNLKEVAKTQGEALANIKSASEKVNPLTLSDAIKNAFESNESKISDVKTGTTRGTGEIAIKEVSSASVIDSTASYYIAGIGQLPVRRTFLDQLFAHGSVGTESGGTITYWDTNAVTRNADNVAECGLIPESDIDWKEYSVSMTKVADSIPVCAEAMEDYAFIESEVRNFLLVNVLLQNDANILAGIDTASQTWVAGAFAGAVGNATTFDVIKVGKSQVENSGENNSYSPNVVLMNPVDYTSMMLSKTTDGQYLFPMYMSQTEMMVDGMRIITTSLIPQDICYIMDSSKGTIYDHRGLSLDYASEHGTDFLHDRIRLRATLRKAFVIRNVNANAFLKVDSIAGAIALL